MSPARVCAWTIEKLPARVDAAIRRLAAAEDVVHVAVLPGVHWAGEVCVGVAAATGRLVYPAAVGGDIGCGVAALPLNVGADALAGEASAAALLDGLYREVPALAHRPRDRPDRLPPGLAERPLSAPALERMKGREALAEWGTLGRGNHFLEIQADAGDRLWAMVHSGSRAIGPAILEHHAGGNGGGGRKLLGLDAGSEAGRAYLADAAWALDYADANRRRILDVVAGLARRLISAAPDPAAIVSCHHNHVRRERHFGRELWVHRKGAIPAAAGEPGLIPGSMGTATFHTRGRGREDSLGSSSHGAGRALARGAARAAIPAARVFEEMRGVWFDHRRADACRDEAPSAYKDIDRVLRAQRDLLVIERRLRPVLSYKGA